MMPSENPDKFDQFVSLHDKWKKQYMMARIRLIPVMMVLGLIWVGMVVGGLVMWGDRKKRYKTACAKRFLHIYFALREVTPIVDSPFPDEYNGPKLIFVERSYPILPTFIMQALDQPLIIPHYQAYNGFYPFLLPIDPLKPFRSAFTYSDTDLSANVRTIAQLLEKGYPVLVALNQRAADPNLMTVIYYEEILKTMLKWDVPTYFCQTRGIDLLPYASPFMPCMTRLMIKSKEDVISNSPETDWESTGFKMAQFFGFENGLWMDDRHIAVLEETGS